MKTKALSMKDPLSYKQEAVGSNPAPPTQNQQLRGKYQPRKGKTDPLLQHSDARFGSNMANNEQGVRAYYPTVVFRVKGGYSVTIDAGDWDLVSQFKWRCKIRPDRDLIYVIGHRPGSNTQIWLHRLLLGIKAGEYVDHRNGNPLDNRRCNLRKATPAQNTYNTRPHGQVKYKGVRHIIVNGENTGRFRAGITIDGKGVHLGSFSTEIEAAIAYDEAARKLHGEFARLNFPAGLDDHVVPSWYIFCRGVCPHWYGYCRRDPSCDD